MHLVFGTRAAALSVLHHTGLFIVGFQLLPPSPTPKLPNAALATGLGLLIPTVGVYKTDQSQRTRKGGTTYQASGARRRVRLEARAVGRTRERMYGQKLVRQRTVFRVILYKNPIISVRRGTTPESYN